MVGFSRRVPSPNSHRTDGAPGVGCHSNGTSLRWRKSRMAYASGDPGRPMTLIAGGSALMPAAMAPGRAGFKWLGSCSDPAPALRSHLRGETVAVLNQLNLGILVLAI